MPPPPDEVFAVGERIRAASHITGQVTVAEVQSVATDELGAYYRVDVTIPWGVGQHTMRCQVGTTTHVITRATNDNGQGGPPTRRDIPRRGTGPRIATYYVVDLSTGAHWPVSTPDAVGEDRFKLVAVPPEAVESSSVTEYIRDADLAAAPAVADVTSSPATSTC